jgi:hypothetical protein
MTATGRGLSILEIPPWLVMWALAGAIFLACKVLALAREPSGGRWKRSAFLLAWPGMDAQAFVRGTAAAPSVKEWLAALGKTMLGTVLYFGVARQFSHPLAMGWIAMIGIIFMLHFGGFHLLSCFWRAAGVKAEPIMQNPAAATSLGEFWGRRWNLAFNELAERYVFRPSVRRLGVGGATLAAFVASGLIHEFVISLPAMGGWGWPTAYFGAQGLGAIVERSRAGRRLGLRRGWHGWLFTMLITAGPAFFLFHPPFIEHIVIPMMKDTGAL